MKKILGITFGGLKQKTVTLVLLIMAATVAVFLVVSSYQSRMLSDIVGETRTEQQAAISQASRDTMHQVVEGTLVSSTALQAKIADNDFSQIVDQIHMLQAMAQGLFESKNSIVPASVSLPDPAMAGLPSAMVLCEEGVDYTESDYIGVAAHMSAPMIALFRNSDKIDGCYIGLADGTDLCIDDKPLSKLDENGDPIPFPVRERPWYKGAVASGGIYFTGMIRDAFTSRLLVTCSAPVYVDGELIGVVGIDIFPGSMVDFMTASGDSAGIAVVVNNRGQVILVPEESETFKAEESDLATDLRNSSNRELAHFIEDALHKTTELKTITIRDKQYYAAGAPMPTVGWAVISLVEKEITELPEQQMLAEYDEINVQASARFREGTARTRRTVIGIIAAVFVLSAAAALLAANRIVSPIRDMTKNIIHSSRTGELFEMKDSYHTGDEIEVLAESFDDLSKKTRQYIENITEITREKERVSTELTMASQIQNSMLPHVFPPYPNRREFDIYATMKPAKEVGGDFYDFFLIDEDHLGLVIADVSGKGVPAALFMMIAKTILQSCAMLGKSASEILAKTNEALCSNNQVDMFVTVWIGILELSTGKLTASNAGHEYPVLKHPDGRFELYRDKHGFVIGGIAGAKYKEYELQLEPGAKLFVYTDGVPEATDAENRMFGIERMMEALNREPDAVPGRILENVHEAVDVFVRDAEQFDDLTMLCLEYKGSQTEDAHEDRV